MAVPFSTDRSTAMSPPPKGLVGTRGQNPGNDALRREAGHDDPAPRLDLANVML